MFVIDPSECFFDDVNLIYRTFEMRLSANDFALIDGRCRDSLNFLVRFFFNLMIGIPALQSTESIPFVLHSVLCHLFPQNEIKFPLNGTINSLCVSLCF